MAPSPRGFESVVGQDQALTLLRQGLRRDRIAPAYLFTGPEGVGRSLTARLFIQEILCSHAPQQQPHLENHPDVLWLEPTYLHQGKLYTKTQLLAQEQTLPKTRPQIRLDQIRQLGQHLGRPPLSAPRSLVVIDQAETMAEGAANGLLKTLEEPGRATIILIAPSDTALLPTLVSRCQKVPFYRLSHRDLERVLSQVAPPEFIQADHPYLMDLAAGSPGAALHHWQVWQAIPGEILEAVLALDRPQPLRDRLELAKTLGQTLELDQQIWLLGLMQQVLWQRALDHHCPHQCQPLLTLLEQARQHLIHYVQPRLVWEVTLLGLNLEHPFLGV
ncbi:DNA polymerase III subunit delta' [Candidatus Synechococcus calcipolaris G9]|uniref:DNA polymerase III subunit delta n=1 Tax=Candidatus Synechococcus calcipolaris G9 TaxID=1497997 RepID=A0ABT6EYM6_9SYNE|nr:DNA polymerase III subunit delta' [Candidatus Synechococcus calcipolaris]MDG2990020.1 DNA polymerase III subunit delta' [Candidatus Synechococcus calcipolaris G9]